MVLLSITNKTANESVLSIQEQVLIPSKTWDWSVSNDGMLPRNMINFSDTLPVSCYGFNPFYFRSERLFNSYSLLLDLLDDSFEPQGLLNDAKKRVQRPSYSPTSDHTAPLGWSKVTDGAGIIRWTPSYSISTWPAQWLAQISKGGNPQKIRLPLASKTPLSLVLFDQENEQSNLPLASKGNYLEITAKALDRIKVTPGAWFNSSLISQAKNHKGSLKGGSDLDTFFGEQGLLNCRISELIVAYKPRVELIADKAFVQKHDKEIMQATQFRLGNIDFQTASKQQDSNNNGPYIYTLISDSEQAIIIAVNVAPI